MPATGLSVSLDDPLNARILSVSEDRVTGFHARPFDQISRLSGVDRPVVLERIRALLQAGVIRRVRQTLVANNLAAGALVAWQTPLERVNAVFDWMLHNDPFTGHVVVRTTDGDCPGAGFHLWTTVKVPQGYSPARHCEFLRGQAGPERFILMPARKLFVLGVGHMRRRDLKPGDKSDAVAEPVDFREVALSELDWRVLAALKRELTVAEIVPEPWTRRAAEAGLTAEAFCRVAASLDERGAIGRFATFLEHVKPLRGGERVTRCNGLFHWAVPPERVVEAGQQVGRFHVMTHAYWRDGGPEFRNVNLMGVAHGQDKALVLEHKGAIDRHLAECGIPVLYSAVFWGGRSEIKPSEILPQEYQAWCARMGLDPQAMRV